MTHDAGGASTLEPGALFGQYRIVRRLGKGGMGEVFLAHAPDRGLEFAVKILNPGLADGEPDFFGRFFREADFSLKARHPNLVEVYDAGRDPSTGLCYLVMEYMPGGSLREAVAANPAGMPLAAVIAVATDVARALAFVESSGLVHRDVKPDNILFAADGTAKLTDLGISRFARMPDDDTRVTSVRDVVGTPAYMSPEQMLDSRSVDSRADLYSLGVVMWEMLAGRRPNSGESAMHTFAKAIEGLAFPDVRTARADTPDGLAALVAALTSPTPSLRPSSARATLDLLLAPERIPAAIRRAGPPAAAKPPRFVPWFEDRSVIFAVSVMALAIIALALAVYHTFSGGR